MIFQAGPIGKGLRCFKVFPEWLFQKSFETLVFWVLLFCCFYTTCKNAWTKIKNALRPARTPRRVFVFFIITNKKYCSVLYSTVQYCQYCTGLYSTVQYCTVLYSTVQYCTVLHSTAQYCTVLCSTVRIRFWSALKFKPPAINLKKSQKIEMLRNRYNTSCAWSYGSGVGTVKIPVKNCIDSWGQILKNRLFGPVTSKWPIVSI